MSTRRKDMALRLLGAIAMLSILISGCGPTSPPQPTAMPAPVQPSSVPATQAIATAAPAVSGTLPSDDLNALEKEVEAKLGRKPKIAIASFSQDNDWAIQVFAGAQDTLKGLGVEVVGTNATSDSNQQVTNITNAIKSGVDAILIPGGYADPLLPVIQQAKQQGLAVITADIPSPYSDSNVTTDSYTTGAEVALKMASDLKGQGAITLLYTPGWHTTDVRVDMYKAVVKEFPGLAISITQPTDFPNTTAQAMTRMQNILQGNPGKVQAVMVGWGLPALGAAQAIEAAGLQDKVGVYSVDGDLAILQMIANGGAYKATIAQDAYAMGRTMDTMAYLMLAGHKDRVPNTYYTPIYLVTADNANCVGQELYPGKWTGTTVAGVKNAMECPGVSLGTLPNW